MPCCYSNNSSSFVQKCPQCGFSSNKTAMKTIFHQVKFPDILDVVTDSYYFCKNNSCSVAYFSLDKRIISKQQLNTFSELKKNKLCFCFDISKDKYLKALEENKAESIKNFVVQKTTSGDCACEVRNPSGKCCLANFKQLETYWVVQRI